MLIVFLHVLFILPAAYVITISPLTGMRQMIQSRYCFGKYGNVLTSIVCILMLGGFGIIGAISGAEVLANVQPGTLSTEVGLVIIMTIAMVIGFMGYRTLHMFTRWAWIPTLIALIILVGVTGDQLWQQKSSAPGYRQYMGVVALLAGNLISWANNCGDYSCCKCEFQSLSSQL
jgi:purine-cytosine permease-like protein